MQFNKGLFLLIIFKCVLQKGIFFNYMMLHSPTMI